MAQLKLMIDNRIADKFREVAMDRLGHTKGSISIAAEEALVEWIHKEKPKSEKPRDIHWDIGINLGDEEVERLLDTVELL